MAKNILLLFLSYVKPNDTVKYKNIGDSEKEIKNSNEPAVLYLLNIKKIKFDKIFILASENIRSEIKDYLNNDGKPTTHLNFFLKRLEEFSPFRPALIVSFLITTKIIPATKC